MKQISIYADGYSVNFKGKSGIGLVFLYEAVKKEYSIPLGFEHIGRAELLAVIHGLKLLNQSCEVSLFSDNQLAMDIINEVKRASANMDLWNQYHEAANGHTIKATWIRQNSDKWNTRAIELSLMAAKTQKSWSSE